MTSKHEYMKNIKTNSDISSNLHHFSCSEDEGEDDINEKQVSDITIEFAYKPHTLIALFLLILWMLFRALQIDDSLNRYDNYYNGFISSVFAFLVISLIICPNGPFVRPHPGVWRLILGVGIIYIICISFCMFQTYEDVKEIIYYVDPQLRFTQPDTKIYGENCGFTLEKLMDSIDVFCLAHFVGWLCKAFILRNASFLWLLSVTWEATEWAFQHLLPNFKECWWDALILDVLICNGLGIHVGLYLCKWLEMRTFHWESIKTITGAKGKLKRVLLQFTPISWKRTYWFISDRPIKRFIQLFILCIVWQINELNCFFLKNIFVVPTSHWITFARLVFQVLIASPAVRQYYIFITHENKRIIGTHFWAFLAMTFMELLLCIRHAKKLFSNIDYRIIGIWMAFQSFVCFFVLMIIIFYRSKVS